MPLISVIIPAYNSEKYIGETLRSLQAQTLTDWEAIVVDDGSKDGTAAVIEPFTADARITLMRQANGGVAMARNNGFAKASAGSQFIAFMDGDDVYLPHALATLASALGKNADRIGAHGLAEMIDQNSQPIEPGGFSRFQRERAGFDGTRMVTWGTDRPTTFETVIQHSRVYPPGLLLTRRVFVEKVGPFDAGVSPVEDWDMLIRLTRFGPIAFVDNVILQYRRHPQQATTASLDRIYAATRKLHRKTYEAPENSAAQRAVVRGSFRSWQRMKIAEKRRHAFAAAASGRLVSATKDAAHIVGHLMRLARGGPA